MTEEELGAEIQRMQKMSQKVIKLFRKHDLNHNQCLSVLGGLLSSYFAMCAHQYGNSYAQEQYSKLCKLLPMIEEIIEEENEVTTH